MAVQATIKDVAKVSGVSIGTVDRVLHNRGRVSEKNKAAVLQAVEELSYRPSQIARALAVRKSNLKLGITYPCVETEFWAEVQAGIQAAQEKLRPFGVELLTDVINSYDIKEQIRAIDRLLAQGVSGMVLTAVDDSSGDRIDRHIPPEIPYGTVINDTTGSRRSFFVGPDDFAIGGLAARLVQLYTKDAANVVILSPNATFNGTQQRISGFLSKVKQEGLNVNLLRTCAVLGDTEAVSYENIHKLTLDCIKNHSGLNALYVTNGLTEWVAAAVEEAGKGGAIQVFGHEYTSRVPYYIQNGIIPATIYQRPAQEWYTAITVLYELLVGDREITNPLFHTECSILMKETLPFVNIGGLALL